MNTLWDSRPLRERFVSDISSDLQCMKGQRYNL